MPECPCDLAMRRTQSPLIGGLSRHNFSDLTLARLCPTYPAGWMGCRGARWPPAWPLHLAMPLKSVTAGVASGVSHCSAEMPISNAQVELLLGTRRRLCPDSQPLEKACQLERPRSGTSISVACSPVVKQADGLSRPPAPFFHSPKGAFRFFTPSGAKPGPRRGNGCWPRGAAGVCATEAITLRRTTSGRETDVLRSECISARYMSY